MPIWGRAGANTAPPLTVWLSRFVVKVQGLVPQAWIIPLERDHHRPIIERWPHIRPVKLNSHELGVRGHGEFQLGKLLGMYEQAQRFSQGPLGYMSVVKLASRMMPTSGLWRSSSVPSSSLPPGSVNVNA